MEQPLLDPTTDKHRELEKGAKYNIQFYMQHLSLPELEVLESTARKLALNYSPSYKKWLADNE